MRYRKYDHFTSIFLLVLRTLLFLRVVAEVLPLFNTGDDELVEQLKVSGNLMVMYALFIPIALRQSFMFSTIDLLCGFVRLVYYAQHGFDLGELIMLFPSSLFVFVILWSLEYSGMVSYVLGTTHPINVPDDTSCQFSLRRTLSMYPFFSPSQCTFRYTLSLCRTTHLFNEPYDTPNSSRIFVPEHVLLPKAVELYRIEYLHARRLLHAYVPNIPLERGVDLYHPRRYRNCSVMAIHVKAADVLPGLVDVPNVAAFLKEVGTIIESCVQSCDLVNVTKYSGIFLAACPDLSDDHAHVDHTTRTIICLREIQTKVDLFSRANGVSVALGVGIACGPVSMGFLGGTYRTALFITPPSRILYNSLTYPISH